MSSILMSMVITVVEVKLMMVIFFFSQQYLSVVLQSMESACLSKNTFFFLQSIIYGSPGRKEVNVVYLGKALILSYSLGRLEAT